MSATQGKLEGRITVPSGGWDAALVGSSSATATIPAGEYYLSSGVDGGNDLLAEVASQFSSATGDDVTCTGALGEGESGKITLESDGGTFEITWTDTDLRDVLGFETDGNLSGKTTYESQESARSVWLPDAPFRSLNGGGSWSGWRRSNFVSTMSPAGNVYALKGQDYRVLELTWPAITRERFWDANEETENQSLEQFWSDVFWADAAWSDEPAGPVRWYPDAATDGTYRTYKAPDVAELRGAQLRERFVGYWEISLELIEEPEGETALVSNSHSVSLERSSSQYLSITDANQTGLDPSSGNLVFQGWIRPTQLPGTGETYTLVDKFSGAGGYAIWLMEDSGSVYLEFFCQVGSSSNFHHIKWDVTGVLSGGTWAHVEVRYDGSTRFDETELLIDESDQGAGTMVSGTGSSTGGLVDNSLDFQIGERVSQSRFFDGELDDFRIWDATSASVGRNQEAEGNETDLVGYWKFNNDLTDATANGNDLTNNNSATFSTDTPFS